MNYLYLFLFSLVTLACFEEQNVSQDSKHSKSKTEQDNLQDTIGYTIESRFNSPNGYVRTSVSTESFAYFLRSLPLKPVNAPVLLYDGSQKVNQAAHIAVLDLDIGNKDLHQCADAIIRLRADYLRATGREDDIHFNFTNGMQVNYADWKQGKRIKVNGNRTSWIKKQAPSNSKKTYWAYLEQIFMYAGTLSLARELKSKPIEEIEIGDIFIQGGSPGHATIVVDMVYDERSQTKKFMLAQSYVPAQEIHILKVPGQKNNPWFTIPKDGILRTPEWTFYATDLKSF